MNIIRILGLRPEYEERAAVRAADVVINRAGVVIKDRNGLAPRPATDAELEAAG